MPRSIDRARGFALLAAALAFVGCGPPAPEKIDLRSVDGAVDRAPVSANTTLVEGDLLVVDADPSDGDSSMDLCIDASSTNEGVAHVARVRGKCRQFVVLATSAGTAHVRFEARGTVNDLALEIVSGR